MEVRGEERRGEERKGEKVIDHIKGGVKNKFDLALVGIALACLIGEIREDQIKEEKIS